jgi:4-hydroxy-3-methylbut-2-en-1-yl diphosphate reductase
MNGAMSQIMVREFQAPGTRMGPGEVLVSTEIGDPVRGLLRSPAAPLVGGTLRRKGQPVRYLPVPRCNDPAADEAGAALFVATCPQRDGSTAAVAAGAAATDRVAVAAARSAVEEWCAVFGTRRLMVAASPLCSGAAQALAAARRAVAARNTVHVCGQLVADPQAISELTAAGAVFTESMSDVPDGGTVLIPAHGVPPEARDEAAARGLEIVDATCPIVSRARDELRKFTERGDNVVLIGQPGSRVIATICDKADDRTAVVAAGSMTATVQVTNPRRVSYLLQPGVPVEDGAQTAAALRSRFPAARGPHPDGFCYAPSDRAGSVRAVAMASDVMLVLGAENSADARYLAGLTRSCGTRTHVISEPGAIMPAALAGAATIGMAESTSADPALAGQVTAALAGLGPLSIASRQVSTQVLDAPEWPPPDQD